MKTTFDIPEPLLRDVQRLAKDRHTTTKSLVEEALRRLLDAHLSRAAYRLPDRSVGGDGMRPEFRDAGWDAIRDAAYGDAPQR
jgi:hypothetical protein